MDALVMGGGGPVGAAWTAGLLHGLVSVGLPVAQADLVLGTSAGAVVGAWLTIEPDGLPALPERMVARAAWHAANAGVGYGDKELLRRVVSGSTRDAEDARAIAQEAIAAIAPVSVERAESLWGKALPAGGWPERLGVAAVDAGTGRARVWSARDGVSLAVAVACSTAAPGAAPPVEVDGTVWVDGGVRSGTNADLVDGDAGRVLVLAPLASGGLVREEAALVERGFGVRMVTAEPFYRSPGDLLDPRFVEVAAAAGAKQAAEVAADLLGWWG